MNNYPCDPEKNVSDDFVPAEIDWRTRALVAEEKAAAFDIFMENPAHQRLAQLVRLAQLAIERASEIKHFQSIAIQAIQAIAQAHTSERKEKEK